VTYRSLPPRAWLREGDEGDWVELAGEIPAGAPLDGLRSPTTVTVVASDGDTIDLLATYPSAALGLTGSDPLEVGLTLRGDGSIVARYEAALATGTAIAETTMRPLADASPIPAPSLGS